MTNADGNLNNTINKGKMKIIEQSEGGNFTMVGFIKFKPLTTEQKIKYDKNVKRMIENGDYSKIPNKYSIVRTDPLKIKE